MNAVELMVVVVGAAGGYWLVNFMTKGRPPAEPEPDAAPTPQATPEAPAPHPEGEGAANAPPPAPTTETAGPPWHEVLGVAPDASLDDLRAARDRQLQAYLPERVASLGPELQALAERKTAEIHRAHDQACAARGNGP